jgi:molybdenum cofactor cytidylyltransferase
MGQPKLLLPLGRRTVIEHALAAFQTAGVLRIVVVTTADLPELAAVAARAGASVHLLPEPTAQMRETVEAGLEFVEKRWQPTPGDAWFLMPSDHPALEPEVLRTLLLARDEHPSRSLFVPTFAGQRGHPVLIGWNHVESIRRFDRSLGLNHYIRSQSAHTLELPVPSAGILIDLDTPADYERLRQTFFAADGKGCDIETKGR